MKFTLRKIGIIFGFLFLLFLSSSTEIYAAPVSIDCSVGSPRTIQQSVDFSSGDDLTLTGGGTCVLSGVATLASLTVGNSSDATILTHADNTSAQTYTLSVTATGNIDITTNASINVDEKGYEGRTNATGYGTGAGVYDGSISGGGGAHGGDGGDHVNGGTGGTAYCDISVVNTIGSGGAGGNGNKGGDGGGLISLTASGTITINGTLSADGANASNGAGGGAGGGIYLSADTIAGTPQSFTLTGGNGADYWTGTGGGGCALLEYTTANSIAGTSISMNGGSNTYQHGGAGQVMISQSGGDTDLYIINGGTAGTDSPELSNTPVSIADLYIASGARYIGTSSITATGTTTIQTSALYQVASLTNFIYSTSISGDGTGTIDLYGQLTDSTGGIVTIDNYILQARANSQVDNGTNITVTSDGSLYLYENATLADTTITTFENNNILYLESGVLNTITDLNIEAGTATLYSGFNTGAVTNMTLNGGTTVMTSYDASTPLSISSTLAVNSGATLTHADNVSSQSHVLNISAATITVASGGSIDVDAKGYEGRTNATGYGPGAGIYDGSISAGGGAHGGDGGDNVNGGTGGTAYCDGALINTIGSGGGGGNSNTGGDGGGLIRLTATGTITINGIITAAGANGPNGSGAGAGGGLYMSANIIAGTPQATIDLSGGDGADHWTGTGGGGCVLAEYATSTTLVSGDFSVAGGTNTYQNGGAGLLSITQSNQAPSVTIDSVAQQTDDGYVDIAYTLTDADDETDCSFAAYEYSLNNSSWSTMTIASGATSSLTCGSGGTSGTLSWDNLTDMAGQYDGTVWVRLTPNDGTTSGSTVSSSSFAVDVAVPTFSSLSASQTSGTENVVFGYTISDDTTTGITVEIDISSDNGSNWNTVTDTSVSGDVGTGVTSGASKTITWDVGTDFNDQDNSTMLFRIRATDTYQNQSGYTTLGSTFTVDTNDPTGLADFEKTANTSTTATFGWTAASDTNFNHYELWYGTSQSDVQNRNGAAIEWDNGDDVNLATASTTSTQITSLTYGETYYVKIWAVDDFGGESTVSDIQTTVVTGGGRTIVPRAISSTTVEDGGSATEGAQELDTLSGLERLGVTLTTPEMDTKIAVGYNELLHGATYISISELDARLDELSKDYSKVYFIFEYQGAISEIYSAVLEANFKDQTNVVLDTQPMVDIIHVENVDDFKSMSKDGEAIAQSVSMDFGDIFKITGASTLYYLGNDGRRYVYPNEHVYKSYHVGFDNVKEYSAEEVGAIPLGGNMKVAPGTWLIKIISDPKVYAVEPGGILRWVQSESIAEKLYGTEWNKKIIDVDVSYFVDYKMGDPIEQALHPDGVLVSHTSNQGSTQIYYMQDSKMYSVTENDLETFGSRINFIESIDSTLTYEQAGTFQELVNKKS